jgi:hypothetical protein
MESLQPPSDGLLKRFFTSLFASRYTEPPPSCAVPKTNEQPNAAPRPTVDSALPTPPLSKAQASVDQAQQDEQRQGVGRPSALEASSASNEPRSEESDLQSDDTVSRRQGPARRGRRGGARRGGRRSAKERAIENGAPPTSSGAAGRPAAVESSGTIPQSTPEPAGKDDISTTHRGKAVGNQTQRLRPGSLRRLSSTSHSADAATYSAPLDSKSATLRSTDTPGRGSLATLAATEASPAVGNGPGTAMPRPRRDTASSANQEPHLVRPKDSDVGRESALFTPGAYPTDAASPLAAHASEQGLRPLTTPTASLTETPVANPRSTNEIIGSD